MMLKRLAVLLVIPASTAMAATRTVPGQHPTIQAAINAASAGDLILVSPGVHTGPGNRNISFLGKLVTVRGDGDAASVIIDAEGVDRGFVFSSGEGPQSRLENVTIRNTAATTGAGVLMQLTSPTLVNVRIENCAASQDGGGIYISNTSTPLLRQVHIAGCTAGRFGGGVMVDSGAIATMESITIIGCTGSSQGGGVLFGGTGAIRGFHISRTRVCRGSRTARWWTSARTRRARSWARRRLARGT